jgi:hypothetical protein
MTYYEAALQVLKAARQPLTTQEILDRAVQRGFIVPRGKTPRASMSAALYVGRRINPELVKVDNSAEGKQRPRSVRWTLRHS